MKVLVLLILRLVFIRCDIKMYKSCMVAELGKQIAFFNEKSVISCGMTCSLDLRCEGYQYYRTSMSHCVLHTNTSVCNKGGEYMLYLPGKLLSIIKLKNINYDSNKENADIKYKYGELSTDFQVNLFF